jgi:hypothetical protein
LITVDVGALRAFNNFDENLVKEASALQAQPSLFLVLPCNVIPIFLFNALQLVTYICVDILRNVILRQNLASAKSYEVKAEVVDIERETMQLRDERGAVVFARRGLVNCKVAGWRA